MEVINGQAVDVHHGLNLSTVPQSIKSGIDGTLPTDAALLKSAEQLLVLSATKLDAGPRWLQTSPYSDADHLLDLGTLALPEQLLAIALANMAPRNADYATTEYGEAFNWDAVVQELRSLASISGLTWQRSEYYVVVFRSQLKEGCDRNLLGQLDKNSHREAVVSGGLLKYWFGSPNSVRRNLATCIWRSQADAIAGGRGPGHRQALLNARHLYDSIELSRLRLVLDDGLASYSFEDASS